MYRDMTRGSNTRGLLLFALPMAAGARVALAYAPAGPVGVSAMARRVSIRPMMTMTKIGIVKSNTEI